MTPDEVKTGMRFGRLIVRMKIADDKKAGANLRKRVVCDCDCGTRLRVPCYYLVRSGNPKSNCGSCHDRRSFRTLNEDAYGCWYMMRTRCKDPKHVGYKSYGGRGIKVCEEWDDPKTGFEAFLTHIGPRPSPIHSIDRFPDPDGNYAPGNVRWANPTEQANNKSKLGGASRGFKPKLETI